MRYIDAQRGRGLFTTADVEAGTLLAAEKALAYVDVTSTDLRKWFTRCPPTDSYGVNFQSANP